jgi:isochorismate synthase
MAFQADKLQPTPVWLGRLRLELRQLTSAALNASESGLLSCTFEVPVKEFSAPPENSEQWLYWHQPDKHHRLLGLGMALSRNASGSTRFQELDAAYQSLQSRWTRIVQGRGRARARAFLGFAFDPDELLQNEWQGFDNAGLYVPELVFEWQDGRCLLTFNCYRDKSVRPESVISGWMAKLQMVLSDAGVSAAPSATAFLETELPPVSHWKSDVAEAISALQDGDLQKVVLTRQLKLKSGISISHRQLPESLAQKYPGCTVFSVNFGKAVLLAASPETLFEMTAEHIYCDALAGTFPAHVSARDARMEHFEHAPVVQAIRDALQPLCHSVTTEKKARAVSLQSLSHLHTPVQARPKPGVRVLQVVEALHPTPAVGGIPGNAALEWIREHEQFPRGWYTGAFGWMGDNQEAQLSVILRCSLIQGKTARLYAGAGITEVSDPGKELEETDLKLEAMLNALKT